MRLLELHVCKSIDINRRHCRKPVVRMALEDIAHYPVPTMKYVI